MSVVENAWRTASVVLPRPGAARWCQQFTRSALTIERGGLDCCDDQQKLAWPRVQMTNAELCVRPMPTFPVFRRPAPSFT